MAVKTINTELLQKMFLAGAANLEAKKEFINELSCPSFFVALQRRSGNIKRLTQLHLRRHVNVQLQLLIRLL